NCAARRVASSIRRSSRSSSSGCFEADELASKPSPSLSGLRRRNSRRGYRWRWLLVGHRRRLFTPVRPLAVLDDAPEEEEEQRDGEDGEADDLVLRTAVDGAAAGDLEPADADDAEERERAGQARRDWYPDVREPDRTRPVRAVLPQQHERGDREHVRDDVADVAGDEDPEQVADEEDEEDVDAHVEGHRVPRHVEAVQPPELLDRQAVPRDPEQ